MVAMSRFCWSAVRFRAVTSRVRPLSRRRLPIGSNSAIFGKLGVIYARTELSTTTPVVTNGKERGFGGRWGVGAQVGLTKEWALRADFDRYRLPFPGDHRDLEPMMLGVQYTFR